MSNKKEDNKLERINDLINKLNQDDVLLRRVETLVNGRKINSVGIFDGNIYGMLEIFTKEMYSIFGEEFFEMLIDNIL